MVEFLPPGLSDHSPSLVILGKVEKSGPRPFKFYNYWTRHPEYTNLVRKFWSENGEEEASINPMQLLYKKLRLLKQELRQFSKQAYGDVSLKVKQLRDELQQIQAKVLGNKEDKQLLKQELDINKQLREACLIEEAHLCQKSRVQWLKDGDQNAAFFFRSIKQKHSREKIKVLYTDDGTRLDDYDSIATEVTRFYQQLLGREDPSVCCHIADQLAPNVQKRISAAERELLAAEVNDEEIRHALFSMDGNKSPGPNGFTAHFFKVSWSVIQHDFTRAIRHFFEMNQMRREVNSTIITLLPKKDKVDRMKDFRPISCCNVVYKCITKIIANRLQTVLPTLIGPGQSAFIKGRHIQDNILLAHELVRNCHGKRVTPRGTIKIDLQKAFDSIH